MKELMELMLMLIHTQREIATLVAKNQNAPKYLYEQVRDLQDQILELAEIMDAQ